jgi:hypothetical protein
MPSLDAAWHQSLTNIKMQIPITHDSLKGMRIMTTVFSLSRESIADVTALDAFASYREVSVPDSPQDEEACAPFQITAAS